MPMDQTDKQLVNGLLVTLVALGVAYFVPTYGYRDQSALEEQARQELKDIAPKFNKYYSPLHPAHYGEFSAEESPSTTGALMEKRQSEYQQAIKLTETRIGEQQALARMAFPEWTEVDTIYGEEPGYYFVRMFNKIREDLRDLWIKANVECDDYDIGFARFTGGAKMEEIKAREFLRELHIAQTIIKLCIDSKLEQEQYEKSKRFKPEAYMRILKVSPQDSAPTGPTKLEKNPSYDARETNPASPRFNKYKVLPMRNFIQEYPVEFELQCDVNTFMRLLHKVRQKDQFLIIRNLEVISPFLQQSRSPDELLRFKGVSTAAEASRRPPLEDEHIYVRISAAGMDFFDPKEKPNGLYSARSDGPKEQGAKRTRRKVAN